MYEYMTRRMVARKVMTYAGQDLDVGDEFIATPDDAGYLTRSGRAVDALPAPVAPAVAPVPVAVPAQEPEVEQVAEVEQVEAVAPRRRGRPRRVTE